MEQIIKLPEKAKKQKQKNAFISQENLQIKFCTALDFCYFLIFELNMTKNSKNAIFE